MKTGLITELFGVLSSCCVFIPFDMLNFFFFSGTHRALLVPGYFIRAILPVFAHEYTSLHTCFHDRTRLWEKTE